ncbi:uncharacterized protein LOC119588657, partial [Penaeus monodon]|uniref:uncharacterized protein LOC119588657 n=1 Tax=Penaeus monodon TaxID=6687 RepID=UPI0018A6E2A4
MDKTVEPSLPREEGWQLQPKGTSVSQQAKGLTQAELIEAEENFLKEREERWKDMDKIRGAQSTQGGRVAATASKGPGVSQKAKGPTQARAQSTQGGRLTATASKGPGVSQKAKGPTQAELIEAEE